mgnify:FL=1
MDSSFCTRGRHPSPLLMSPVRTFCKYRQGALNPTDTKLTNYLLILYYIECNYLSTLCLYPLIIYIYMKIISFPLNDKDFSVDYFRPREGPNWFRCYYKNAARGIIEPLDAWRTLGVARNMDTGKALKAWCLEMHETYGPKDYTDEEHTDVFFDNTKMVT